MTQNNLATAYSDRIRGERAENIEKAIAFYKSALEVYSRDAFPQNWAMTQNNLAIAYKNRIRGERAENIEKAIACYKAALEVRTRDAFPQNNAETLFNLGLAYRDAAQLTDARKVFAEAIETVEEIRSGIVIGGEADREILAAEWNRLYINIVEVCLELGDSAAALEYAERSKARNLVELLAASRLRPEGVSQETWERYRALCQEFRNLQQQGDTAGAMRASTPLSPNGSEGGDTAGAMRAMPSGQAEPTTPLSPNGSEGGDTVRAMPGAHSLARLRQDIDALVAAEINPHDPKFRFGQGVEPIRYAEIQGLLPAGAAIVEWYFTSKGIQVFIVLPQGEQPILASAASDPEALAELTNEYKNDYIENEDNWWKQLPSYLERLAAFLELDTLVAKIPEDCRELILIPYRYLHLFPLHALPLGENRYFGDLFPQGIRYAPSSQILQLSLSPPAHLSPQEACQFFAIQNPTEDLSYTDIEVEAIQTAFNPAEVLPGKAASKTAFKQAATILRDTAYAHFSCHGSFDFANPRNSALILANAELPESASAQPNSEQSAEENSEQSDLRRNKAPVIQSDSAIAVRALAESKPIISLQVPKPRTK